MLKGLLYGTEIRSLPASVLQQAGRDVVHSEGLRQGGVKEQATWIIIGARRHPGTQAALQAIQAYAREVWTWTNRRHLVLPQDHLLGHELGRFWGQVVNPDKDAGPVVQCLVAGLRFFGAVLRTPTCLATSAGDIDITIAPWPVVKAALESVVMQKWAQAVFS